MAPPEWDQGPLSCHNDVGECLYTLCCPCLAFKEVAENIGDTNGVVYCLATFPCGCGCCVLSALGQSVADLQGIPSSLAVSAAKSFFDLCCCYSCTVLNESRNIKAKRVVSAHKMDR